MRRKEIVRVFRHGSFPHILVLELATLMGHVIPSRKRRDAPKAFFFEYEVIDLGEARHAAGGMRGTGLGRQAATSCGRCWLADGRFIHGTQSRSAAASRSGTQHHRIRFITAGHIQPPEVQFELLFWRTEFPWICGVDVRTP
jgi:hypothetical protein